MLKRQCSFQRDQTLGQSNPQAALVACGGVFFTIGVAARAESGRTPAWRAEQALTFTPHSTAEPMPTLALGDKRIFTASPFDRHETRAGLHRADVTIARVRAGVAMRVWQERAGHCVL